MTKKWLVCATCGKTDKSDKAHVGTQTVMRCVDCCNRRLDNTPFEPPMATMCRDCCPTNHGTKVPFDSHFEKNRKW